MAAYSKTFSVRKTAMTNLKKIEPGREITHKLHSTIMTPIRASSVRYIYPIHLGESWSQGR